MFFRSENIESSPEADISVQKPNNEVEDIEYRAVIEEMQKANHPRESKIGGKSPTIDVIMEWVAHTSLLALIVTIIVLL